jgi:diguanylate cyclase (GGDEF)-like protein
MCGIAHSALGQAGCTSDLHHRARQGLRRSGGSAHLGGFKSVNDRLGHATGDELLQWVAGRLVSRIRGYGGDEFVILLLGVDSEKSAAKVAQKLRAHLAKSYVVNNHSIAVTASIGVAVYPHDGGNRNDLIRRADIAMYLARAHNNSPAGNQPTPSSGWAKARACVHLKPPSLVYSEPGVFAARLVCRKFRTGDGIGAVPDRAQQCPRVSAQMGGVAPAAGGFMGSIAEDPCCIPVTICSTSC